MVAWTREARAGYGYRVTAAGLAEVLSEALALAPGLAGTARLETRVGFRPDVRRCSARCPGPRP